MKKMSLILLALLILCCLTAPTACASEAPQYDPALAQYALQIAETCYIPSMQKSLLEADGYRQAGLFNDDRPEDDARHVATYALYDRQEEDGSTSVILAIRGTGEGEWKLNMELMPSGDYNLPFAENFFLAAQDILSTQDEYFGALGEPTILITGHSRGAAVANVLGAYLTDRFGEDRVRVYTFATPGTVRGEPKPYRNIFNVINPADIITYLPFPQWGFGRYGIDVILPVGDDSLRPAAEEAFAARRDKTGPFPAKEGSEAVAAVEQIVAAMTEVSPDIPSAYTVSHALLHRGAPQPGEAGFTTSEFLLMLFDGSLPSGSDSAQPVENDFTDLIALMQEMGSAEWIGDMHMPATYGAWMTVMDSQAG